MPAIDWTDVESLDAKFSTVDPTLQTVILARVEKLSSSYYGGVDDPRYKLARMLLAAHMASPYATGSVAAGVSGPVTQRTEGGVSESYAVAHASLMGLHSSTAHGRAFDELTLSMPSRVGPLGS